MRVLKRETRKGSLQTIMVHFSSSNQRERFKESKGMSLNVSVSGVSYDLLKF